MAIVDWLAYWIETIGCNIFVFGLVGLFFAAVAGAVAAVAWLCCGLGDSLFRDVRDILPFLRRRRY